MKTTIEQRLHVAASRLGLYIDVRSGVYFAYDQSDMVVKADTDPAVLTAYLNKRKG